jgi:hypothetical protein
MTDVDRARLELARRAWLFWNASDEDVEAGVRRVGRRLRVQGRSTASRRALTLVPVALAFFAALAYGQTGGFEHPPAFAKRWFGDKPEGSLLERGVYPREVAETLQRLEHGKLGLAPVPVPPSSAEPVDPSELPQAAPELETNRDAPSRTVAPERPKRSRRPSAPNTETSKATSSWRQIDEALAADDEATARELLQGLARGADDATTQAKARLGLAQLSLSRGDCKRAVKIAGRVARSDGIDEKLVRRAHDIVLRCQ